MDMLLPDVHMELTDSGSQMVYIVPDGRTQKKLLKFFGEKELAVVQGGSMPKLQKFYGISAEPNRTSLRSKVLSPLSPTACKPPQTLSECLESKDILYFLAFCVQELVSENLFFVMDNKRFVRNRNGPTYQDFMTTITTMYLREDASLELNLSHQVKKQALASIQMNYSNALDGVHAEVMQLLEHIFSRFLQSDIYKQAKYHFAESGENLVTVALGKLGAHGIVDSRTIIIEQKCIEMISEVLNKK
jgi:hypothetical protein